MPKQKNFQFGWLILGSVGGLWLVYFFLLPDFPRNLFTRVHHIAELAPVLVACCSYPYLRNNFMRWFLPYHVFIFLAELLVAFISLSEYHLVRHISNLCIGIASTVFYGYVFYHFTTGRVRKKQIKVLATVSAALQTLSTIFFIFSRTGMGAFARSITRHVVLINLNLSGLISFLVALLFLYESSEQVEDRIFRNAGFWLALGVCLFNSGASITSVGSLSIDTQDLKLFGEYVSNMVARLLCIVLYGCTCVAMIRYAVNVREKKSGILHGVVQ